MKSVRSAKVFTPQPLHSKRRRLLFMTLGLLILSASLALIIFLVVKYEDLFLERFGKLAQKIAVRRVEEKKQASFRQEIIDLVDKKLLEISSVETSGNVTKVISKEGLIIYFSQEKDLREQVRTLQTLLSKAKIESKALQLVDFRFDKLVVTYK